MTLLEVILAVALMAMVGASMLAAIGAIDTMQTRARMQLAGCEVGNRLLLTYLHEKNDLPSKLEPIQYGPFRFMYEVTIERVRMELNTVQASGGSAPQGLGRYRNVTMTIYQVEMVGDTPTRGEQVAQIARVVDPAAARNPETLASYKNRPDKIEDLIRGVIDDEGGSENQNGGGGNGR